MSDLWKMFVTGHEIPARVKPTIRDSWNRSRKYNINYERFINTEMLTRPQLNERCQSREPLVRAAKNVLPTLFNFLQNMKHIVLLSDQEGYILESAGEPTFLNKVAKVQVAPGTNWREDARGTNAIGTILHEQVPLTVFSWEHYVEQVHFIDCWASPIKSPSGEIIGVLDISAEASRQQSSHLLGLAVTGARLIELNLQLMQLEQSFSVYRHGFNLAGRMLKDGLLAIDNDGIITEINNAGAGMLGYKREEIIGQLAAEVFKRKCCGFKGEASELYLEMKEGPDVLTKLQQVHDSSGIQIGTVGTLESKGRAKHKPDIIGCSQAMNEVIRRAEKAAGTNATVLLTGESGTGKEKIARFIHDMSQRAGQPFLPVNCAAIPENLIESELFGYTEGSFTGAKRGGMPGKFEAGNGGTIFLDEVGDMPLSAQASLLRVLQEKEIFRIGGNNPKKIDVRIVAATNQDLNVLTKLGRFRLDLYYRLNVVSIMIPPLRQRPEDLYELIPYFLRKACLAHNKPPVFTDPLLYDYFTAYTWPGNIRELENCLESMVVLSENRNLSVDDLPPQLRGIKVDFCREIQLDAQTKKATAGAISNALREAKGNRTTAAQKLGIGRTTLYRKMKELGLH